MAEVTTLYSGSPASNDALIEKRFALLTEAASKWLPILLVAIDAFATWMAWRVGWGGLAIAWFVLSTAQHLTRLVIVKRWQARPPADLEHANHILGRFYILQGIWRTVLIAMVFSQPAGIEHQALTVLCLGIASGAVPVSGWDPRLFLIWSSFVGSALAIGWIACAGSLGAGMALLIIGFLALLYFVAVGQLKTLKDVLELAQSLEAANQSKSQYLASVSHDLRTPLAVVVMNSAELARLAGERAEPEASRLRSEVGIMVDQCNDLLDQLSEIARLSTITITLEPSNVMPVFERLQAQFRAMAAEKDLELVFDVPSEPIYVNSATREVHRLIAGLIDNALKYTAAGEVRVSAQILAEQQLCITVSDTGPGIPSDQQELIFQEFYRIKDQRIEGRRGSGLGLFIVSTLARALNTTVSLVSTPGHGAAFSIKLPLCAAGDKQDAATGGGMELDGARA